jgi:multiple sugar transport system ATP-binding protein
MTMADKIVVLNAGNIEQVGSPLELYRKPKNLFVAGFIGSPKMNFVEGPEVRARYACKTIGVRPEHIAISRQPIEGVWTGTVGVAEHLGADTFVHVNAGPTGTINVRASGEVPVSHGDSVWLTPDPSKIHRFDANGLAL